MFYVPKLPTALYVLILLVLVLLCVSRSAALLTLLGTMGVIFAWQSWRYDEMDFERLFYGHLFVGHVRLGRFIFLWLLLMFALVVISRTEDLDQGL